MLLPSTKHVVMFACSHALLMLGLFAFGFDLSAVDGVEPPRVKQLAMMAAGVLMLPGRLLWTAWASKNLPNGVQWLLLVANSALWGFLIAAVVSSVKRLTHPRPIPRV
jgi:hypothetical protein